MAVISEQSAAFGELLEIGERSIKRANINPGLLLISGHLET